MPPSRAVSPFARPRWNANEAREVLAALARSGKSVSAFAAEHGLDPQRVYLWRRRFGKAEPTTFQEVIIHRAEHRHEPGPAGAAFELVLASGDVIRIPASFDAAALIRVLDVLSQTRAC
jgi:transposase-like protein